MGANRKHKFSLIVAIVAVAIFSFHFTSQTIFGVIGYTPTETAGILLVGVFVILVAMSLAQTIALLSQPKSRLCAISDVCSSTLAGGWLGLSVGNAIFDIKNPPLILVATVVSAVIGAIASRSGRHDRAISLLIMTIVAVATYGLAFLCSSIAFAFFSTGDLWWGTVWASLCLLAIATIGLFLNSIFTKFAT